MNFNIIIKRYFGDPAAYQLITSAETGDMTLSEACALLNDQADKIEDLKAYINTLERLAEESGALGTLIQ